MKKIILKIEQNNFKCEPCGSCKFWSAILNLQSEFYQFICVFSYRFLGIEYISKKKEKLI